VSLEQLLRFFVNPCRTLLGQRLKIGLTVAEEELPDDEPFLPDYPGRQALARRLLPSVLAGADEAQILHLALAGNEFPSGAFGERLLVEELARMQRFAAPLRPLLAEAPLPAVHARFAWPLADGSWQLAGALSDLRGSGLLRYRYDDVRPTDYLAGWINHLFLCAAAPADVACRPPGTRATAAIAWHRLRSDHREGAAGRTGGPLPGRPVGAAALLPEERLGVHPA
jgi:exodeoxyribonuclease V gamma subunit